MKASLVSGLSQTGRHQIDTARTIGFMGEDARVYSTPDLVRDIEDTCREAMLRHLDAGEDSVGTGIAIRHLAPTLMGMWVEITVTIVELKGRAATFAVEVKDQMDLVCRGTHDRAIVQVDQTKARLKAKAEKAAHQNCG